MSKGKNFEEMMEELEEIVARLEEGNAPLDEAVALFEKGVKLSSKCHGQLDKAEQKVKVLEKLADGIGEE